MNPGFFCKWNLDKSRRSGEEAFAKKLNFPDEAIAAMKQLDMSITISQQGAEYKFDFDYHGVVPGNSIVVTPGQPCEVTAMGGNKAQLVLTVEGNKIVETYSNDASGTWVSTRTLSGNEHTVVSVSGDATMSQVFVKA